MFTDQYKQAELTQFSSLEHLHSPFLMLDLLYCDLTGA